ncbi:Rho termination protein [Staphylococcus simulans]|uniref:Rho termination factor N-terminal domain-containing protein n=1 Tax=Staphylococcus simulans TaxID=1286 RepID=UPI000E69AAB2|nr:Rho termination factor N-terminal domain-containing protein [Staphylococcus simulans]RIN52088.1 Rho termination protein [Staphylococcus simulans]
MLYKVITRFKDADDDNYLYEVGDLYPREGYYPTDKRIDELSTTNNRRNVVGIEPIMLNALKVSELKAIAEQLEIEQYSSMKKAELIEAIEGVA